MNPRTPLNHVLLIVGLAISFLAISETRAQKPSSPPPSATPPIENLKAQPDLFEVSLGFDYIRIPDGLAKNLFGFDVSAFANINSWLALGGEFMAGFGSSTRKILFQNVDVTESRVVYVFGPRVTVWQNPHFRVFAEAMAGGGHGNIEATVFGVKRTASADGLAAAVGAGADWRFAQHWSWRVVEADYLPMHFNGQWQDHWRVSTAIAYSFGSR